jgi:hypothetical protein
MEPQKRTYYWQKVHYDKTQSHPKNHSSSLNNEKITDLEESTLSLLSLINTIHKQKNHITHVKYLCKLDIQEKKKITVKYVMYKHKFMIAHVHCRSK